MPATRVILSFLSFFFLVGLACDEPPLDKRSVRNVTGIMDGAITYVGPRPRCKYNENAVPTAIAGRVVLLLYLYTNPPPPQGTATSSVNILAIPGEQLFNFPSDCMPLNVGFDSEEYNRIVTRSTPFLWPDIAMDASYQIRGFYDTAGDFLPFFVASRSPSLGDVLGMAVDSLVDATAARPTEIRFGAVQKFPLGQVVSGVSVILASVVKSEPPVFRIQGSTVLPSSAKYGAAQSPYAAGATEPDAVANNKSVLYAESLMAGRPATQLEIVRQGAGFEKYAEAFVHAGLDVHRNEIAPGWFVEPMDGNGDGRIDASDTHRTLPHYPLKSPLVYLKRARTPQEKAGGVPDVTLVATGRRFSGAIDGRTPPDYDTKRAFSATIPLAIPAVAIVDLEPDNKACKVAYIPPATEFGAYFESQPSDCQELPTGRYTVTVMHGVAAAATDSLRFSPQSWTIPNELGPADRRYNPEAVDHLPQDALIDEQGPAGRFTIYDPDPVPTANDLYDDESAVRSVLGTACTHKPRSVNQPVDRIQFPDIPDACCAAVRDLCPIPLCAVQAPSSPQDPTTQIREATTLLPNGKPQCLPFLMPTQCCKKET